MGVDQQSNVTNLVTGLTNEILRVTEIRRIYLEECGAAGLFAAGMMEASLISARHAQGTGDIVEMMAAITDLKTYEL